MSEQQREEVAESIKTGGACAVELAREEEEGRGPIITEAVAELVEGGGPVLEAVADFDQQSDDAQEMLRSNE